MAEAKREKFTRKIMGRPPSDYTKEEVIELGERMDAWMKECDANPKCDVVHLSEFYSEIEGFDRDTWKESIVIRDYFSPYYKRAMDWMAKRTMKNKHLATAYGSRFLGVYSEEVRQEERQIMRDKIDYEWEKRKSDSVAMNTHPNAQSILQLTDLIDENRKLKERLLKCGVKDLFGEKKPEKPKKSLVPKPHKA
jgi:hypothetical protein